MILAWKGSPASAPPVPLPTATPAHASPCELQHRCQRLSFVIVTFSPFMEVPISALTYDPSATQLYVCLLKGLKVTEEEEKI